MATLEELKKENERLKLELQETKLCFKSFAEVHKQTCEELNKVKKQLKHAQYKRAMAMSKILSLNQFLLAYPFKEKTFDFDMKWIDKCLSLAQKYKD